MKWYRHIDRCPSSAVTRRLHAKGRKMSGRTRITGATGPAEFIDGWSIAMHGNRAESNEEVKL